MNQSNPKTEYYENGNLKSEIRFDEDGNKKSEKGYDEDGNLDAEWEYDDNGNPKFVKQYYEDGNLQAVIEYHKNGNRKSEKQYYENGDLDIEIEFHKNGKPKKKLPEIEDIMLPILKFLKDGYERNYSEVMNHLMTHFGLSERRYTIAWDYMHETVTWAKSYMSQAALLRKKPRIFHISDMGLDVLEQKPKKIDRVFLKQIKGKRIPNKSTGGKTQHDGIERFNELIASTRDVIMSRQKGAYMSDIRMILGISQEEMSSVASKVVRIDGISKNEIRHEDMLLDILFTYSDDSKKTSSKNAPEEPSLDALTREMLDSYARDRRRIDKHLRWRLTTEFVKSKSMKKIFRDNPDIAREKIILHVRTSLRLPERLRQLEQEGAIHTDPNWSLHIALFAVNHYGWEKGEDEERVVLLAQQLAKHVRGRPSGTTHKKDSKNSAPYSGSIPTATAVWIATAELHMRYGKNRSFSNGEIVEKIRELDLLDVKDSTIAMHVSLHCVANVPPMPSKHRKLYRVSHGRYRLYRSGDDYDPKRKHGEETPAVSDIPYEHRHVLDWYHKTNPA